MPRIKVHEQFHSVDTSDEWKDNTYTEVYFYDTESMELTVETTKSFHDYRNNIKTADSPTTRVITLDDAPSDVHSKLKEKGYM